MAVGFGTMIVFVGIMTAVSLWGSATTKKAMDVLQKENRDIVMTLNMTSDVNRIFLNIWSIAAAKDMEVKEAHKEDIGRLRTTYQSAFEKLKSSTTNETTKQLLDKYWESIMAAKDVDNAVLQYSFSHKEDKAVELFGTEGNKKISAMLAACSELVSFREKLLKEAEAIPAAVMARVRLMLVICGLVILAFAFSSAPTSPRALSSRSPPPYRSARASARATSPAISTIRRFAARTRSATLHAPCTP